MSFLDSFNIQCLMTVSSLRNNVFRSFLIFRRYQYQVVLRLDIYILSNVSFFSTHMTERHKHNSTERERERDEIENVPCV